MPPMDPTPLGDELARRMPERKFPEPKPGQESDDPVRGVPADDPKAVDVGDRPPLPTNPESMAADVEDEDSDPVVDHGPGIADGVTRPGRQRG